MDNPISWMVLIGIAICAASYFFLKVADGLEKRHNDSEKTWKEIVEENLMNNWRDF